jgi:hypothetical protein
MRDWMMKDAVAWLARPPQQGQHSLKWLAAIMDDAIYWTYDVLPIDLRKDYPFHYTTSHLG